MLQKGEERITDVRLVTKGKRELKPLVEAAVANELKNRIEIWVTAC